VIVKNAFLALQLSKSTLFDTQTHNYETREGGGCLSMISPGDYLVWDIGFAFDLELGKDGNMATLSAVIQADKEV
jgi:hypothetical protein